MNEEPAPNYNPAASRISINEICHDLQLSRVSVFAMLRANTIPNIRLGRRWFVSRYAYGEWLKTVGMAAPQLPVTPMKVNKSE